MTACQDALQLATRPFFGEVPAQAWCNVEEGERRTRHYLQAGCPLAELFLGTAKVTWRTPRQRAWCRWERAHCSGAYPRMQAFLSSRTVVWHPRDTMTRRLIACVLCGGLLPNFVCVPGAPNCLLQLPVRPCDSMRFGHLIPWFPIFATRPLPHRTRHMPYGREMTRDKPCRRRMENCSTGTP